MKQILQTKLIDATIDNTISFSITCFMGKQRSGKTLSMVENAEKIWIAIKTIIYSLENKPKLNPIEKERLEKFKKYELWSNLDLNKKIFGNYTKITPSQLIELYNNKIQIKFKLLVLDDLFKNMDSRNTHSEENKALSYFTTEIGKNQNILLYVSHFSHRVEKRLREMTETFILCRKGKFYNITFENEESKYIFNDIWIEDSNYYKENQDITSLKAMVIKQVTYNEYVDFESDFGDITKVEDKAKLKFLHAYKYFKFYKTDETV